MTIRSMTGFARESGTTGAHRWAWELKTVNGRGLEIRLRVPPGFDDLGEAVRRSLSGTLSRGQCQLSLTLDRGQATPTVRLDTAALASLTAALGQVPLPPGVGPASLDGLLSVRGIVQLDEGGGEAFDEHLRADLEASAIRLGPAVQAAREEEGRALASVLAGQLARMEDLVEAAETCPARQPEAIKRRLADQIAALMGAAPALDPGRLHQEAVMLATRADIREELDRLRAHLASARGLLDAAEPVGRRLDFLAQEFGREANTLCAKANDVTLSRIGLDLKAAVEQFREQVQNVD
jgi:uncharacterized protein (TIGR00255 family)